MDIRDVEDALPLCLTICLAGNYRLKSCDGAAPSALPVDPANYLDESNSI
jgi:hypothetical protein